MKKVIAIIVLSLMPIVVLAYTMFPGTNGLVTTSTTINLSTYYPTTHEVITDVQNNINLTLTSGRTGICFIIGSNTNIILNNATLENVSIGACGLYIRGTNNTITLLGENKIRGGSSYPAIYVHPDGEVTIKGDGYIRVSGGSGAAAIGSNDTYESGNIIIEGNPTILAEGIYGGAAIGGGIGQSATNITIKGGNIVAYAYSGGAAAIGGGGIKEQYGMYYAGNAGTITITGEITAYGNGGGSGIGGGGRTSNATVTSGKITAINISGGNIRAIGGTGGGCGIGKGSCASYSVGDINITGGRVESTGKAGGAGIGAGYLSSSPNITISGGAVFAEGSSYNSYVFGDDIGYGGNVSGGSSTLNINGNTTAVFARNNRWHSNKTTTGLSYVYGKFDGICVNSAYGYRFPPLEYEPYSLATAYGYIKQYYAYFRSNGGNYYNRYDKVSPVEDITPPSTNPTRTGYTFTSWYKESSCYNLFVFLNHPISSNTTIYAGWSPNEYEITFDKNLGTSGSMANQTMLFDKSVTLSKSEYQRTGYTFNGWNTKADDSGTAYTDQSSYTMNTEGATLYAVWAPNTYTVTFDGNTNTGGSTANQIFTFDAPQNLTANGFIKTGYTFAGWNSIANGSGIAYIDGESVNNLTTTDDSTIPLYAQWEIKDYSITYHLDNGINDTANPASYTIESADIILADATKEDYTFIGWYADADFTTELTTIAQGSTGEVELYAKFSPISYPITYNIDNGINDAANPAGYTIESADIILADANKEGYTFLGWYSDSAFSSQVTTIAQGSTGEVELYAKFSPISYPITYNIDNGINNAANPAGYTIESADIILADATKEDYTFLGWYSDSAFSSQVTTIAQGSTGEVELYAKFSPISYPITYNIDNGINDAANPAGYTIESADIILADANKEGYTFLGWYADADFTTEVTTIAQGSTGEVELYAKFSPISYPITYNIDNGINDAANPAGYTIESADIILADANKEGYTFLGWYSDSAFSSQVTTIAQGSTGEVELYAKFSPISYPITYNIDNGINDAANPAGYTIESADIILADANKEGYTFLGWYAESDFTTQVTTIAQGSTGEVELYAKFSPISYPITYNNDNGINDAANPAGYTIESADIILADATKEGYTFLGWYAESDFTTEVTTIAQGSTGEVELYAKYSPISYPITYNIDNGINDEANPAGYTIESADIILADANKEGYTFLGWYAESDFTTEVTTIAQGSTGEVELYAKYSPISYPITYNIDNGINDEANPAGYTIESADIILADATKDGYTFLGWYSDSAFSSQVSTIAQGGTGKVELYAKFSPISYPITYNIDNGINDEANPAGYTIESADIILADATKEGYTFLGWYSDSAFSSQVSTIAQGGTGKVELYAKFSTISYPITYHPYNGINDTANPADYTIESADIILADATKEGYTFMGWYADANFAFQVSTIPQGSTGVVELYAKFNIKSYTVYFLDWDGELLNQQSVDYGNSARVPSDPIRTRYLFDGWYTDNGTQEMAFSNITNNLTVTARYISATTIDNTRGIMVCVYPNPVSNGKLFIKTNDEIQGVTIIDIRGRVVYVNSNTKPTQSIDVNNWESGMYFIRIANRVHKFIVK